MKKIPNIIPLLTILVVFIGSYFLLNRIESIERSSISFFEEALRDTEISENISMRGKKYNVENGIVTSESEDTIKPSEELGALKIAYGLTTVRRSPLFGIAGTDPQALRQAVDRLKEVQYNLSKAQANPRDASMVASSLYPINFLYSLSKLEENRLKFLASGADADSDNYEESLQDTIRASKSDIKKFKKSFQKIIGAESMRFLGFGGTMTTKSMLETISLIQEGINRNENIFIKRNLCVSGKTKFCDKTAIEMPTFKKPITGLKTPSDRNIPPLVTGVRAIFIEASGRPVENSDKLVALDSSSCLGSLPGPYYFLVRTLTGGGERAFRLFFAEDIFFRSTKNVSADMPNYMNIELKISFSPINPVNFYVCSEVGNDMGRAYGTLATTAFAKEHSSLAVRARNQLLRSPVVVYENDAASYIGTAMSELKDGKGSTSEKMKNELTNLVLMFHERSAGLEFLVKNISDANAADLRLKEAGVPLDISARNFFLTHSAFPSLFLSHNPSAGAVDVHLNVQNKNDTEKFLSSIILYSNLRLSVPREKIVADIRAFLKMEGNLFSQRESLYQEN